MIVLNICYVMFLSGAIKYWIAWTNAKEKLQSFCRARIGREKDEKKEGIERWGYLYETALFLRKRKEEEQCEQKRGTAGGRKKTETRQVRFSCIETVLFFSRGPQHHSIETTTCLPRTVIIYLIQSFIHSNHGRKHFRILPLFGQSNTTARHDHSIAKCYFN